MSDEQLMAFMEAVKADAGLQEQLKSVVDPDGMVAIAKAEGFDISVAPLSESQEEITEEELEDVAGGIPGQGCFNNSQRQFRTGV